MYLHAIMELMKKDLICLTTLEQEHSTILME